MVVGNVFVCKRERESRSVQEREGMGERTNEREIGKTGRDEDRSRKFTVCGENGEMVYRITI